MKRKEDIFEEEVPLADVPVTGDRSPVFAAMVAVATLGLSVVQFLSRKKDNEA